MFGLGYMNPLWLLMTFACIAIAGAASLLVRITFARYARRPAGSGITGAQAAQIMLERNGIHDVSIQMGQGFLSDLYNPLRKVIVLSPDVYRSSSLSAIGVACHEAGHAVQHHVGFFPVHLRNTMVPVVNIANNLSWLVIIIGLGIYSMQAAPFGLHMAQIGVLLFSMIVVFQIVTLPVEFDASRRALALMTKYGIVTQEEKAGARAVLTAAALTYVAAVITALLQLLYWMYVTGMIGGRRSQD